MRCIFDSIISLLVDYSQEVQSCYLQRLRWIKQKTKSKSKVYLIVTIHLRKIGTHP